MKCVVLRGTNELSVQKAHSRYAIVAAKKMLLAVSRPYGVYGAQDSVREADGLLHEYEAAHHRDDDDDGGDAHVPHGHAYDCDALHHDAHIRVPKHWLVSAGLD